LLLLELLHFLRDLRQRLEEVGHSSNGFALYFTPSVTIQVLSGRTVIFDS